jgi:hydrogenase maturation protein HypF
VARAVELRVAPERILARVEGTVQGVGFRPFVYRLAREEDLAGYVLNDQRGVLLEVEGHPAALDRFLGRMRSEAPPLAAVDKVSCDSVAPEGSREFRIVESARRGDPDALVAPDTTTCAACLSELSDPADRRYRYPFINCTNCGPRFTIVRGVPYDRPLTTMSGFRMCADCRREYDDPADRRFHAQPNACPRCGPRLTLTDAGRRPLDVPGAGDAIEGAARRLADGLIVAVKGLGGFHLACNAADEEAVAALRARKRREDKPFALMVADRAAAARLVELAGEEDELLHSIERPIVLTPRRRGAGVAAAVAPAAPELGIMLPYTPVHHVLLGDFRTAVGSPPAGARFSSPAALVMTSGNVSDEPIAYRDDDAIERLAPIADLFLLHDRPIHSRTDDSVARVVRIGARRRTLPIRRSRGYVPGQIDLPVPAGRPLLACGADLKNTFCGAKGTRAWVSHHIGDLEHYPTHRAFREGIDHFETLFAVQPLVVAHDLHPGYFSTAYALEREGVELVSVQHHHAHLAACLAEHGLEGPAVGAIYDGTGYGTDGTVWGGELLVGGLSGFERVGSLWPARMPGGEAAIREPWRMACAWLTEAFGEPGPLPTRLAGLVDERRWRAMSGIASSETVSPVTTSMGRLFDAVAALCGIRASVNYEGQAAIELEGAAADGEHAPYDLAVVVEAGDRIRGGVTLDARSTVRAVVRDLESGVPIPAVAGRFHAVVADATARACAAAAAHRGLETVVLSGGVFQNRLLLERTAAALDAGGLRVLTPERLPPGDGGISFGQAAVAAAR